MDTNDEMHVLDKAMKHLVITFNGHDDNAEKLNGNILPEDEVTLDFGYITLQHILKNQATKGTQAAFDFLWNKNWNFTSDLLCRF